MSAWDIRSASRHSVFARPQLKWLLCGVGIAILGLLLRGYAAGHLRKHKQLATSGPYAFTRNPLYLGSVFLAAGFSVASHSWISALLLAAYLAVFYPVVIRREQGELEALYGAAFRTIRVASPGVLAASFRRDGVDGTILVAPLPAESGIRSGHRPGGGDGHPVDDHAVAGRGVVEQASACWFSY